MTNQQETAECTVQGKVNDNQPLEYSVVYSDRSLNHMSTIFQQVMRDLHEGLMRAYHADSVIIVPGGGTYGMEAIARQFAQNKNCMVIRNGWFSYRWTQIFEMANLPANEIVLKAKPVEAKVNSAFAPAEIHEVVARIHQEKPDLVFAPHVETSAGIRLPDDYITTVSNAVHEVGGMMVLDCIASGTSWVDMKKTGVDILVSAPQKGWSASPCAAMVMLNDRAKKAIAGTKSNSFACDLKKWFEIMDAYLQGGHAYHATMPTDGLKILRDTFNQIESFGLAKAASQQDLLGVGIRKFLIEKGCQSVAAPGFEASSVIVFYTDDDLIKSGKKFLDQGVQIAAGVPLQCDEPADFKTFRIGLFGLDKLQQVDATLNQFKEILDKVF